MSMCFRINRDKVTHLEISAASVETERRGSVRSADMSEDKTKRTYRRLKVIATESKMMTRVTLVLQAAMARK